MPLAVVCDIDGVLHRGRRVLPGAARFVRQLRDSGRKYIFLTNSPDHTPEEQHELLKGMAMDIPPALFYTSAQAAAAFLACLSKRPRVYMIGSRALRRELKTIGARFDDRRPEF